MTVVASKLCPQCRGEQECTPIPSHSHQVIPIFTPLFQISFQFPTRPDTTQPNPWTTLCLSCSIQRRVEDGVCPSVLGTLTGIRRRPEVRESYRDVATNRAGDSAIKFLLRIARCFLWQSFGLDRERSSRDRLHRHLISLPINVPATIASRRIYIHLLTYSFRHSFSCFIMLLHCHVFFGVPLTGRVIRRFSGESDSL